MGAIMPPLRLINTLIGKSFPNTLGHVRRFGGQRTIDWRKYLQATPWRGHNQKIPARLWAATAQTPHDMAPGRAMKHLLSGLVDYGPAGTIINTAIPVATAIGLQKYVKKRKRKKHD